MAAPDRAALTRRQLLCLGAAAIAAPRAEANGSASPRRGGVFRIRGEEPTSGFDPHLAVNHHRIGTTLSFTHSRLVRVKTGAAVAPGTLPLEADLAESWSQPTDRTYVFVRRRRGGDRRRGSLVAPGELAGRPVRLRAGVRPVRTTHRSRGRAPQQAGAAHAGLRRYLAEHVYCAYGPSVRAVAAWEPYVHNFAPNVGHDYGSRLMVAWLDR